MRIFTDKIIAEAQITRNLSVSKRIQVLNGFTTKCSCYVQLIHLGNDNTELVNDYGNVVQKKETRKFLIKQDRNAYRLATDKKKAKTTIAEILLSV